MIKVDESLVLAMCVLNHINMYDCTFGQHKALRFNTFDY